MRVSAWGLTNDCDIYKYEKSGKQIKSCCLVSALPSKSKILSILAKNYWNIEIKHEIFSENILSVIVS